MRRIIIFLTLVIILAAVFQLSRISQGWHYVVPAVPGELLYVAAFEENTEDWEETLGQLASEVADGVMRLNVSSDGEGIYSTASPYFDDFEVEVVSRVTGGLFDGDNNNGYGVIFRQLDRSNYYFFIVSSDGSYRLQRVLDGEGKYLSDWIFTDVINTATDATNTLRVVGQADQFQFYINDTLMELCIPDNPEAFSTIFGGECLEGAFLTTLTDDTIPFGRLGVAVEQDRGQSEAVIVEFDNFVVYGPQNIE